MLAREAKRPDNAPKTKDIKAINTMRLPILAIYATSALAMPTSIILAIKNGMNTSSITSPITMIGVSNAYFLYFPRQGIILSII
ncbi:hypothetical protein SDC9_139750 [bioreactor metagenome]|uniref:Uncharacterized protein n=1 Tax=bioreactor metagenome TaxID=1076179 RepID=A0A645DTL2_9ZZZZ